MKKDMNVQRKKLIMYEKKGKKKPVKVTGDKFKKKALSKMKLEDKFESGDKEKSNDTGETFKPRNKFVKKGKFKKKEHFDGGNEVVGARKEENPSKSGKKGKFRRKVKKHEAEPVEDEAEKGAGESPLKSILKKTPGKKNGVNVKSLKRKSEERAGGPESKKIKTCELKFKARKKLRKQQDKKFDDVKKLKMMWEDLRRDDCSPDKKSNLLDKVCSVVKGRVKEFAYAHDTVRILETVIMVGADEHRSLLFEEMKDDILLVAKSKYAKHFLFRILKYGSKKQKEVIMNAFQGLVTQLMKHSEAAQVVEMTFNECANSKQRFQMVQEFYGPSYRFFKESDVHNLSELLQRKPEIKESVISNMKEQLLKVLNKSAVKHSLVHHVLLQFFQHCDPASRSEIIESLNEVVPEILHTKDGSRVAMHCVWHGTNKDRKVIIKHMKTFVAKIAMEEHGHMVLLAIFDCVDDTKLVEKVIIKELQENLLELSQNVHGKKVLVYLLSPRDPHYCHPDIVNILKGGDNNSASKKDPEIRRQELKLAITNPLTELIVDNISSMYKNNAFDLFTVCILKHAVGDKRTAFEAIAKIAAEPYTTENKNVHIIEYPGSYFMLKHLIMNDKADEADDKSDAVKFSEVLVNTVPDDIMKTWFRCNRGAFLLVMLIETQIPSVIKRVKEAMTGCNKQLDKFTFKGAAILKKRLKEQSVNTSA